jgi:long-chain acyl-CoA synthetase
MSQTIVELFEEQVHRSSVRAALRRHRDGLWEEITWKEWWEASERLAAGLMDAGLGVEDEVCVLVANRAEWVVVDMGLAMAGAVSIPLHPATSSEELQDVLSDNQVRTFVVDNPVQLAKVVEAIDDFSTVDRIVYLEREVWITPRGRRGGELIRVESMQIPDQVEVSSYDDISGRGRSALAEDPRFVSRRRQAIDDETVATILYTAGVSHRARGVVLTHANLYAQVQALSALQVFSSEDGQLLFLPLAHIFGRVLYLAGIAYGMTTVMGRGAGRLFDDLAETSPTLMASVPHVYERLQQEIEARVEKRGWRARLLPLALEVGKTVSQRSQGGDRVGVVLGAEHRLFSKLLLEDVRQRLGGRMRFLMCGGAPLSQETAEFFFATGVLLLQGYGLTEASGVVSFNMPDEFRFDSVGKPLPGVDVTIAEDGEILLRGDTIMKRYKDDLGEHQGRDEEGWFHTGDLGRFDRQGFLRLTGRKRQLLITSTGARVVPSVVEDEICDHPLVAHALVVGEGRPFLGALIALDPDGVLQFVTKRGLDKELSVQELTNHDQLFRELNRHIEEINGRRSPYDRVRRFEILPEFLSVRSRTLSPSGQARRVEILKKFEEQVEALFARAPQMEEAKN